MLAAVLLCVLAPSVRAQFDYTTNGGTITLTHYAGSGGAVTISNFVVNIGASAFANSTVTSVTIPNSVTNLGDNAFSDCESLTNVIIGDGVKSIGASAFSGPNGWTYSGLPESSGPPGGDPIASIVIPDSVTCIGDYAFFNCARLNNVVLGRGLVSIGEEAFSGLWMIGHGLADDVFVPYGCQLSTITIPIGVTNIADSAFEACSNLTDVFFAGNAPALDSTVFQDDPAEAHYLPGTTGWANFATDAGVPTALWTLPYPLVLNGSYGLLNNQFGFTISWATNVPVVVQASVDLSNPIWTPVATNTLGADGTSLFRDPQWTNYPARFYRLLAR